MSIRESLKPGDFTGRNFSLKRPIFLKKRKKKNLHWTFSSNELQYINAWCEVTYNSTEYDVAKQPYITSESTLMETVADGWLPRAVAEKISQVQYKSLSRKKQDALRRFVRRSNRSKDGNNSGKFRTKKSSYSDTISRPFTYLILGPSYDYLMWLATRQ